MQAYDDDGNGNDNTSPSTALENSTSNPQSLHTVADAHSSTTLSNSGSDSIDE